MAAFQTFDGTSYALTFADEFDGTALNAWTGHGSSGVWSTSFSPHLDDTRSLASNGESQYYVDPDSTTLPNPFSVANGELAITAQELTAAQQLETGGLAYASGLLTTEMTFAAEQGYFEMRADLPDQQGFLSAFWLLPADGDWSEEIDVAEVLGSDTETLNTNYWIDGVPDEGPIDVADLSDGMHTYGLLWTEDEITWFMDGVEVRSVSATINEPMYVALSLAVGTNWTGATDGTTDFNDSLKIDYVRVYEAAGTSNETIASAAEFVPDQLYGPTRQDDILYGTRWDDDLRGKKGDDQLFGDEGNDKLRGNKGNDELFGGAGNDVLRGNRDDDKLVGGAGSDKIVGGRGNDNLWGGSFSTDGEADKFVFNQSSGQDLVHDFTPGEDLIILRNLDKTWSNIVNAMDDQGWATILDLTALGADLGTKVSLLGVTAADLTAEDFGLSVGV